MYKRLIDYEEKNNISHTNNMDLEITDQQQWLSLIWLRKSEKQLKIMSTQLEYF
jgi:hypothetical protein